MKIEKLKVKDVIRILKEFEKNSDADDFECDIEIEKYMDKDYTNGLFVKSKTNGIEIIITMQKGLLMHTCKDFPFLH